MNIVIPIVLMAVILGLFVPERFAHYTRWGIAAWIAFVIAAYYWKH
ncbi:MAG: hypothetical protein H7Z41_16895 [Cytophagales bacterium]|nr:hypothetical protein [Armatimonadota bacterium]